MSFTFNGVNSDAMGLFVEKYPERPFPTRKQTVYNIHGRSGDLVVDEDAFSNVTQTYEVYIRGGSAGFQAKATAIAHWLLSPVGYATLYDSYEPTTYRNARFTGGVSFLNSLNKYGKATISFDCCPQRYPSTPESLSGVLGDTFTIPSVPDLMNGLPLIAISDWVKFDTSGKVETDTLEITIPTIGTNQTKIYIDFETRTIYNATGYRVTSAVVSGAWNSIGSGDTIVTTKTAGTTTPTIEVLTRRWYL